MIENVYKLLKKDIQSKIGKNILRGKDCTTLSKQIYTETKRQISDSTLKRFFGIIKSRFNPSKYTLETMAIFLGFNGWVDYLNSYDDSRFIAPNNNSWEILKKKVLMVTELSLSSLKQKTDYDPDRLIFRSFARKRIIDFARSEKTATMFIAPDGYGKSTLLIQMIENYFLSNNALLKDDIVALIDGGIFFNLYSKNPKIDILNQILEFKINSGIAYFFQKFPEKRKGKIWVIIDNVDEIFFDKESYHKLAENLVRLIMANDVGWFKMILTCRPENLNVFTYLVNKNPLLKTCFQDVSFLDFNLVNATNIPLFNKKEMEDILSKLDFEFSFKYLDEKDEDILNILRDPYLLSLFIEENKKNEKISPIVLFQRYIQNRIYSPPYQEEKQQIINAFIELCGWGRKTSSVKKEKLLSRANYRTAYKELISFGIIYEYNVPAQLVGKSYYVKFNRNVVFEYFLFERWRFNRELSKELFYKIKDYYEGHVQLQCSLLKFFARFLIHEQKYDLIKQLHHEMESKSSAATLESVPCLVSFSSVIKDSLMADTSLREKLGPWVIRSKRNKLYSSDQS